jgi:PAS domain S-box-containing protein
MTQESNDKKVAALSNGPEVTPKAGGNSVGNSISTQDFILEEGVYQQFVSDLPAAVYICDAKGRIQFFNDAAAMMWDRRPVIGVDMWCGSFRIRRPDGSPLPLDECPMAITLREGRAVRDVEILVERPDGTLRHVLPYPSPIFDSSKRLVGAVNMLVDITELRQATAVRKAGDIAQARLAAIVESSDDAIISKNLDGIITSWNRSAEVLFGYSAKEAIGKSILLIVPGNRRDEEVKILGSISRGQRIDHFETQRVTRDGRLLDISLTVSPVRDSSGTIIGASKVARDITERKRYDQEREKLLDAERHAREEAQRVNRMKDEFLATLSHELRTPLNAVMGWAQMLASGHLASGEMKEAGQIIERNARTQKQLIDDLLDMSRIVSGKLRLDVQRVEPLGVVETAVDMIRPSADAKGVRLEKVLDPLAGPISGDPARLQQMLWNLLTNAIKFTPRGGRVQVLMERVDSHIELSVSDTGQGIKPDFVPHLFARFSQAEASANRKHGGLGLGLAIVKQLVELHGGSVHAQSAGEGLGATFSIRLPLLILKSEEKERRIHPHSAAPNLSDPIRTDLSRLKVMVVDDERDARHLIDRLLKEHGAEVRHRRVGGGGAAIARAGDSGRAGKRHRHAGH